MLINNLLNSDHVRFFSLARYALSEALRVSGVGDTDYILIPEYICRDIIAPINLNNETDTHELAKKIAQKIGFGMLIYLSGDLGSGKTTFARNLIHELGFVGTVKSPSYSLVEQYTFDTYTLNHFDLYL